VSLSLHVGQGHNGNEATDMQARRGRVKTNIAGDLPVPKQFPNERFIGNLLNKSPFIKNIVDAFQTNPLCFQFDT